MINGVEVDFLPKIMSLLVGTVWNLVDIAFVGR